MNAIIYILVRQYANRIRRLFKKPLYAVLTILAVLSILSGPIMMFIAPQMYKGLVGEQGREIVVAAIQLFIGLTLIISALSQQGGLFSYPEANLLFSSPLSKKIILMYSTLQTLPASVLTSLFMCFYFPFVIGSAMTGLKFLATLLVMSLMVFCIYILYYYIYIQDIGHPGLKARLRKFAWISFAAMVAIFALVFILKGYDFKGAAFAVFTSTVYNMIPIFGWAKWSIASLLNGQYLMGFVPATLLLAISAYLLARLYYSLKVDFFEKAQLDSIRLQQVLNNIKSSGYDTSGLSIKKVYRGKEDFRPGAGAILSRQVLEMKKRGPLLTLKEFINGAIYIIVGLVSGLGFEFVFGMIIFSMIASTAGDTWNAELKKTFIYLIPENSFKKLVYAIIPGLIKTTLAGIITLLAATLLYGISFVDTLCYILLLTSYILLFEASGAFTYRIMGRLTNAVLLMFLRILFVSLSIIPGAVLAGVLYAVTGIFNLPVMVAGILFVNIICSLIFLFQSRKILEQGEFMNG